MSSIQLFIDGKTHGSDNLAKYTIVERFSEIRRTQIIYQMNWLRFKNSMEEVSAESRGYMIFVKVIKTGTAAARNSFRITLAYTRKMASFNTCGF